MHWINAWKHVQRQTMQVFPMTKLHTCIPVYVSNPSYDLFKVFASKYWLFCKWIVPASNVWLPYFYFNQFKICVHIEKKGDIEADILMKGLHVIYGSITIAGEGFQNLDLCLLLMASEQWGIFIVPHLLWHGNSVLAVSSKRLFN